jgi:hypothetical protein
LVARKKYAFALKSGHVLGVEIIKQSGRYPNQSSAGLNHLGMAALV